jgi:hypothetical protein
MKCSTRYVGLERASINDARDGAAVQRQDHRPQRAPDGGGGAAGVRRGARHLRGGTQAQPGSGGAPLRRVRRDDGVWGFARCRTRVVFDTSQRPMTRRSSPLPFTRGFAALQQLLPART